MYRKIWEYPLRTFGRKQGKKKVREERLIQEKRILVITNSNRAYFAKMLDC